MAATLAMFTFAAGRAQTAEPADSTVEVTAWFCTTDTLEYAVNTISAEIADGDTTVTNTTWSEFRICVLDSTRQGFKLEYVPTSVSTSDSTSSEGQLLLMTARMALGNRVVFSTDENGVFKQIENQKEVMGNALSVQQRLVDWMYEQSPSLYAVMSKTDMLKKMKKQLQGNKEHIMENNVNLRILFLNHGQSFPLGEREVESGVGHITYIVSKGPLEGEKETNQNEYQVYYKVERTEPDGTKATNYYDYAYFADGWPRNVTMTIEEQKDGKTMLTQTHVEWVTKAW